MNCKLNRAWAEIHLDNIEHNVKQTVLRVGKMTETMAVVKADAYGHGCLKQYPPLVESGLAGFVVSMLDEAIQLRNLVLKYPYLF